jgi:hypothetical protein
MLLFIGQQFLPDVAAPMKLGKFLGASQIIIPSLIDRSRLASRQMNIRLQ